MMNLLDTRELSAVLGQFLPRWVPSLLLSTFFLVVWIFPSLLGWDRAQELEWLVVLEIVCVAVFAYLLAGRDEPLGWLPILPVLILLGFILWLTIGSLVAFVLPAYIAIRVGLVWGDAEELRSTQASLYSALLVMAFTLILTCYLPLPPLGWALDAVPDGLPWQVPAPRGDRSVPYAIPAWGCLYFGITAIADRFDWEFVE